MRRNFEDMTWDVVMVNGHPYLHCESRIDRESVPEGLLMYEVADADCDGRFCRVSSGIMVNFLCTIVGKDALPMDGGTYYCKYDAEFDQRRDELLESLDKQLDDGLITEEEHESKIEDFDTTNFPDDEDGGFIEYDVDVATYLANYDRYLETIADLATK